MALAVPAYAATIRVGDDDGYGFGLPNGASVVDFAYNGNAFWPGPGVDGDRYDGRDAAEQAATNGAQITDVYSALFPDSSLFGHVGPNAFTSADVIFPLDPGVFLTSGSRLTIDLGDFQAHTFGALTASYNGFIQPGLLDIYTPGPGGFDLYGLTNVLTFLITDPNAIAKANADRQFVLTIARGLDYDNSATSSDKDFVAFDYFELNTDPVPEPATLVLFGTGAAAAWVRRRSRRRA